MDIPYLGGCGRALCLDHRSERCASEAERDEHFKTVAQVIDKEIHLVAERGWQAYLDAGYPDSSGLLADGLRLHYASTFAVAVGGELAGDPWCRS